MVLGVVRHLNHAQGEESIWFARTRTAVGFIRCKAAASAASAARLLYVCFSCVIILYHRSPEKC